MTVLFALPLLFACVGDVGEGKVAAEVTDAPAAEEKAEAVKRWSRAVDQAVLKYKSGASRLAHWLETDVPKALAVLGRMARALEAYLAVESPVDTAPLTRALTTALEGAPQSPPVEEEEPPQ